MLYNLAKGEGTMAKNLEVSFLLDFYGNMLTEKQRDALEYYYNEDLSLGEIALNLGITRQGVRDAVKRAEGLLFEMEERLGLVKRFREMLAGLNTICTAAQVIRDYNNRFGVVKEIEENVRLIEQIAAELSDQ